MASRTLKLATDFRDRRICATAPATADTHVQRDLLDARHLHDRAQAQLILETRTEIVLVELLEPGRVAVGGHQRSMSCPQSTRLHTRIFWVRPFSSRISTPTRVGRLQTGQTSITRETGSGEGFDTIPPGSTCGPLMRLVFLSGRGRVCRLTMFRFSTITFPSRGRASITRPSLPRSLPARMCTVSPLRIFMATVI